MYKKICRRFFQTPGFTCKDQHITDQGIDQDGRVCHCYEELCNKEVPEPNPDPSPDTTCTTTCTTACTNNLP